MTWARSTGAALGGAEVLHDDIDGFALPQRVPLVALGRADGALPWHAKRFGGRFGQAVARRWFAGVGAILAQARLQFKNLLLLHCQLRQQALNRRPQLSILHQQLRVVWRGEFWLFLHGLYCRSGLVVTEIQEKSGPCACGTGAISY